MIYGEKYCRKIRLAANCRNEWGNQVFYQRVYNSSKGNTHDHADRQVDDIAFENKLFKSTQHIYYLTTNSRDVKAVKT